MSVIAGSLAADPVRLAPASAASMPRPVIFTPLLCVQRSDSGVSRRCACPAACAPASALAASATRAHARAWIEGAVADQIGKRLAAHPLEHHVGRVDSGGTTPVPPDEAVDSPPSSTSNTWASLESVSRRRPGRRSPLDRFAGSLARTSARRPDGRASRPWPSTWSSRRRRDLVHKPVSPGEPGSGFRSVRAHTSAPRVGRSRPPSSPGVHDDLAGSAADISQC